MKLSIILGFTHSDRLNDYVPMQDGFRPNAVQTMLALEPVTADRIGGEPAADALTLTQAETVAEACFAAMNRPSSPAGRLENDIRAAVEKALALLRANDDPAIEYVHTLSVGDTVHINGASLGCMSKGWERVAPSIRAAQAMRAASPE